MPNEAIVKVRSAAAPDTVFKILSDPERAAQWLGPGSVFTAAPNGPLLVPFPHSAAARGSVTHVVPGKRVEFTWGYDGNADLPPGSSHVSIELQPSGSGTLIVLRHSLDGPPNVASEHEKGWRHYLAALAHTAFRASGQAERLIDDYHAAWNAADSDARSRSLERCWAEAATFRDSMGSAAGRADFAAYIDAARRFAPGIKLQRSGDVLYAGSALLYPWSMLAEPDATVGTGYNVAQVGDDGLLASVTGFWAATGMFR